ncbi:MAG: exo-alpha-sialidase [Planctomycetota bacterium]
MNISRWGGQARALVAVSTDYGRTWTVSCPSNRPMATSKPYTGTLSTGQNYLICTTTADSGGRRSPLTIAVSRAGEETFSQVLVIRHALFPDGPGPSHANCQLCYPYAVEQADKLYVGYAVKNHLVQSICRASMGWPTKFLILLQPNAVNGYILFTPRSEKNGI